MLKLICGHALQNLLSLEEKQSFYDELKCELDMHSAGDVVMCLSDSLVGILIDLMELVANVRWVYHRLEEFEGRMLLEFCLEKGIMCVKYMVYEVTFKMGENETEIDFVSIKKEYQPHNVKAMPDKFQYALVVAIIDKMKIRNVVRKSCT